MERSWNEVLQSLFKTSTVEVEQEALRQLHMKLTREAKQVEKAHELGDGEKCSPDVVNNGVSSASPYNGIFVTVMIKDADTLNKFVCYVFERRYGWSEAGREGSRRVRRMSSTGVTLGSSDGQQKAIINDLLDNLIKWISTQEICHQLLDAFCYTLKQVTEMPVVRNRAVIHLMEWLKGNKDILYDNKNFPHILSLINVALSDVWSAIRSSCAKQLGHIYTSFNSKDQESIFSSLAKSCTCDKSSWQAKEGAIMGINSILHQYRDGSESTSHTPVFSLSMSQDNTISCVPGFISQSIHFVVFKLLYDQQLTIRENAAKALSTYITCANVHEASSTFKKVMEQLQQGVTYSRHDHDKRQDGTTREGADIVNLPVEFLDAYAAEGLLNVCQFLVKVLPLRELLPFWPQHISTFLIYLSHPASTVRQASSTVFKCLVSKCSHFGVLIKLVIQSLVEGWETDISVLQREEHKGELTETLPSVTDNTNVPLCDTWESREGRLFAFELIMQFLIKNHWVYTFGPAGIGAMRNENCESTENNNEEREKSSENLGFHNRKRIHSVSECSEPHSADKKNGMVDSESDPSLTLHFKSQGSMAVKTIQEHTSTHSQHSSPFNTTFSVLMQIQYLDHVHDKKTCHDKTEFTSGLMQAMTDKRLCVNEEWMQKVSLRDFGSLLTTVLYETLECLADPRWELNRMAQQVLPCLAEVIRWYDISLLEDFWRKHLSKKACLLTFGAVLILKESVAHSIILQKLLQKPPVTWQNPELCSSIIRGITNTMKCNVPVLLPYLDKLIQRPTYDKLYMLDILLETYVIPSGTSPDGITAFPTVYPIYTCRNHKTQYVYPLNVPVLLPYLDKLIQRPTYDKLSVTAATTIIMSHTHFSILSEQRVSQIATVLSFWKLLFCFTHTNSRICKELLVNGADLKLFTSPLEGYLSCCLVKPDNKLQCAKQVEKCFIGEIHHEIKNFLQSLPVESISTLLPILAHYTGLFVEDTHICKALSDCLSYVGSRVVEYTLSIRNEEQRKICLKCLHLTLKELAAIVTMKSSELHLIQKVLNCYLVMCKPINPVRHLKMILVAICSRVSEGIYFSMEHSPRPDDDLSLLSNDIPLSNSTESLNDLDLDDNIVIGSPNTFPECLALNLSNNSLPSGRLSAQSQHSDRGGAKSPPPSEGDDDSSDWDSWDEDQSETQSAINLAFSEFLRKLRKVCDNVDVFGLEMKKLETKERSLIREIID